MTLIKRRDGHGAPNELLDVQIYAIQLKPKTIQNIGCVIPDPF